MPVDRGLMMIDDGWWWMMDRWWWTWLDHFGIIGWFVIRCASCLASVIQQDAVFAKLYPFWSLIYKVFFPEFFTIRMFHILPLFQHLESVGMVGWYHMMIIWWWLSSNYQWSFKLYPFGDGSLKIFFTQPTFFIARNSVASLVSCAFPCPRSVTSTGWPAGVMGPESSTPLGGQRCGPFHTSCFGFVNAMGLNGGIPRNG